MQNAYLQMRKKLKEITRLQNLQNYLKIADNSAEVNNHSLKISIKGKSQQGSMQNGITTADKYAEVYNNRREISRME